MQHPDETTTPQSSNAPSNASRRKFLQGAAIATATTAAATAAGAAFASASHSNLKQAIQTFGVNTAALSGVTCSMCIENSSFTPITSVNSSGTEFIWFTAENLPSDTYTLTYTLNDGTTTTSFDPTSTSATPFALQSNGNNAFLFQNAAGTSSACPSADPAHQVKQGFDLDNISPTPTESGDLQFKLHVRYDGSYSAGTTLKFTGTLKNSGGTTVCTASISITVKK